MTILVPVWQTGDNRRRLGWRGSFSFGHAALLDRGKKSRNTNELKHQLVVSNLVGRA
jgi:hypothetical protein